MVAEVPIIFPDRPLGDQNAIDTIAELRALDSTDVNDNTNVLVAAAGFFKYDPSSLAADNGTTVIKPDDITALQAGRWLLVPVASGNNIIVTPGITLQTKLNALDASIATNTTNIATNASDINAIEATLDLEVSGRLAPNAAFAPILGDGITIIYAADGQAQIGQDLEAVFNTLYSPGTTARYVSSTGNDANTGLDWNNAFLTLGKTRTENCSIVYVGPGTYSPADWRYSDTGGASPRKFIAPYGATIGTVGTALSGLTYAANGTYPKVYEAALADPPTPLRVLRADVLDDMGMPTPMPLAASLLALNTAGYGWFYDATADKIYICNGGQNIETSFKPNLRAVYVNATVNQTLLYSSVSYWEGFTFQSGFYVLLLVGQAQPVLFAKNCNWQYTFSVGVLNEGGKVYTQDCAGYRTGADGQNQNLGGSGAAAYALLANWITNHVGDEESYPGQTTNPATVSYNKQGSSNHNAVQIIVGGFSDQTAGQVYADAMTITSRPKTWMIGTVIGRSAAPATSGASFGLYIQNGDLWVENVTVPGSLNGAIVSDTGGIINNYNLRGVRGGTGTYTPYTPTPD